MKRLLLSGVLLFSTVAQANVYKLTTDLIQTIKENKQEDGSYPDLDSILSQYCERFDQQLQHHANVNVTGDNGETALMVAVKAGLDSVVGILLQHGAAVDVKDKDDFTAMMHLVKKWVTVDGSVSYIVRFMPVDSELAHPEKCLELLLDAGAESFEHALISVEHATVKQADLQELEQYTGFKRFVMSFKKLNPKKLAERATRRIKMRRLRKEQENK